MNNEIISKKSCEQPRYDTLTDCHITLRDFNGRPTLKVSDNGWQSIMVDLPLHMYDLLRELVNDAKVVEYYEDIRRD